MGGYKLHCITVTSLCIVLIDRKVKTDNRKCRWLRGDNVCPAFVGHVFHFEWSIHLKRYGIWKYLYYLNSFFDHFICKIVSFERRTFPFLKVSWSRLLQTVTVTLHGMNPFQEMFEINWDLWRCGNCKSKVKIYYHPYDSKHDFDIPVNAWTVRKGSEFI